MSKVQLSRRITAPTLCLPKHLHIWALSIVLIQAVTAWSQTASSSGAAVIDSANVEQLLGDVSAETALSEDERATLIEQLEIADNNLRNESAFKEKATEIQDLIDSAPKQVARFEGLLEEAQATAADAGSRVPEAATLNEIESQLSLLGAERKTLTDRRSELLQQMNSWTERTEKTRDQLVELQGRIDGVRGQLEISADSMDKKVVKLANMARLQAWTAEKQVLELDIISEPARDRIRSAERAWINRALADTDVKLEALTIAAKDRRANDAEQTLKSTTALAEKLQSDLPELQDFANANRKWARRLPKTAADMEEARKQSAYLQSRLGHIEQDSNLMRRRLEVAGRKEILGKVMIERLDSLPDVDKLKRGIKQRNELIAATSLAHINADEEFRALADRSEYLAKLLPKNREDDVAEIEIVNTLVDDRQQLLETNMQTMGELLRQLVDNNVAASQLISDTEEYDKFLLGNLLWVRNFSFVNTHTLSKQVAVLFSPPDWARLPADTLKGIKQLSWPVSGTLIILLCLAIIVSIQLKKPFEALLMRPIPLSAASIWQILLGLGMSAVLVLPWPLLLLTWALFLSAAEPQSSFLGSLSPALLFAARSLYALLFIRHVISKQGVGRRLLKWDARMLDSLRQELDWAGPLLVVCGMVDNFSRAIAPIASGGPLGALATMIIAGTIIAVCLRLLRNDIFAGERLLKISFRLCSALALGVIVMQFLGLLFAADTYMIALSQTIILLASIKLVTDILERWFLILRAKIERKVREEQRSIDDEDLDEMTEADERLKVLSLSEAHAKLLSLARLLAIGLVLWVIWSPSLPALNLLDSMTLWEVTDPSSEETGLRAITVFDLFIAVFVLIVTGLIAKHLPSLVQIFMLEWVKISPGARYASSILMQYVIVAIGGSIFLSIIGWDWSRVQWLVAALGVGIGFGLQEIVANFISGIIILFERPIRVGDTISVSGAEGIVKEITPRATIIKTFEGKEHLIPNKEIITGEVINWSLTENAVRVVIPVGIAYGSDVRGAMTLLLECAREVKLVLADPAPSATFEDFGDNSLLLWLRCFVAEDRPTAWTELRTVINEKFEDAGISIAFPQRDIHLDTSTPLRIQVDT